MPAPLACYGALDDGGREALAASMAPGSTRRVSTTLADGSAKLTEQGGAEEDAFPAWPEAYGYLAFEPELDAGGAEHPADPGDFATVVFYDWDGTLLGSRIIAKGGSLEGDHNSPDKRGGGAAPAYGAVTYTSSDPAVATIGAADQVVIRYVIPKGTVTGYVACDCGYGNTLGHQTDCAMILDPAHAVECDCGADTSIATDAEKVHDAGCAYATNDAGKCDCGLGDVDAAHIGGGSHDWNGAGTTTEACAYAAGTPDMEALEWGDTPTDTTYESVEAYLNSLPSGAQVHVTAQVADPSTGNLKMPASGPVEADITLSNRPTGGGSGSSAMTVKYDVGEHGALAEGSKKSESVKRNGYPERVPDVVANEGWKFLGWSQDGKTVVDPTTVKITKSVTFTALYEEVKDAGELGAGHVTYIVGNGEGAFMPEGRLSRAEAATMIARLHPDWKGAAGSASFTDVAQDAWYYGYVTFAAEQGIVEGRGDGVFAPDAIITRAELSAMLVRYMGLETEGLSGGFSDTEGHWADAYITALKTAGVADGYTDGTFRPDNAITRAEAVKLINGAIGRAPVGDMVAAFEGINPFNDVDEGYWAFADIMEAAVEHAEGSFHIVEAPAGD